MNVGEGAVDGWAGAVNVGEGAVDGWEGAVDVRATGTGPSSRRRVVLQH